MKKHFLSFAIYLIYVWLKCPISYGQISFKNIYEGDSHNGGIIIAKNNSYNLYDRGINIFIYLIDSNGNLQSTKPIITVLTSPGGYTGNNYLINKGKKVILNGAKNYNEGFGSYLISYNTDTFDFIWVTIIDSIGMGAIYEGNNSSIIISTCSILPIYPYVGFPEIISTDSMGTLNQSYQFHSFKGLSKFTFQNSDFSYTTGLNIETLGVSIARIDTLGNTLWSKSFFRPKAAIHAAIKNTDKSITILGSPDTISLWQNAAYSHTSPLFLMKIDTSGSVLWCKSYGDSVFSFTNMPLAQLKASSDGGYLICSTIRNISQAQNDLIIIKTDANGDTLWTRTHGNTQTNEYGNDISETSDGGYIICGSSDTKIFQHGGYYIIKTDSLGMTANHCDEYNTPFEVNNITPNDSNVTLTVVTGLVTQGSSLVTDTVLPNPPTADGCVLAGVSEFNSYKNKIPLYPNPTQGHFKINTGNNTPKLTVYIYDIIGNLLFEKQYTNQTEIELDLNNRGTGVYTVRVYDGEVVTFSKVVVE